MNTFSSTCEIHATVSSFRGIPSTSLSPEVSDVEHVLGNVRVLGAVLGAVLSFQASGKGKHGRSLDKAQ